MNEQPPKQKNLVFCLSKRLRGLALIIFGVPSLLGSSGSSQIAEVIVGTNVSVLP